MLTARKEEFLRKPEPVCALSDLRFRALLSAAEWEDLPPATRKRFSKRLAHGETAIYAGEVVKTWFSPLGRALALAARLIGGPLPTGLDTGVPSIVTVTEDMALGGQVWTRLYARRNGFPQVIHSAKRFSGPTGLEEYVGWGISMALKVSVEDRCLSFRSTDYFLRLGKLRLRLPKWLTLGALTVQHIDIGNGMFLFWLDIEHPRFGKLLEQSVIFRDAAP